MLHFSLHTKRANIPCDCKIEVLFQFFSSYLFVSLIFCIRHSLCGVVYE